MSSLAPSSATLSAFCAIGVGACLGAWARWGLGLWLNGAHAQIALGTLAANLIGGFVIGLAVAWFAVHSEIAPAWRLFLITGVLGALTTFSTFSAEALALIEEGRLAWALGHSALHLGGSLLATCAGLALMRAALASN